MAQYKVPQDVEADDKLIGPFSFRQFVYILIAAGLVALCIPLWQLFPLLIIIPLPIILFFLALSLPLKKDQPMETYLSAVLSYYLKPHNRLWEPGEPESTIIITAPKKTEEVHLKNLDQEEALHRLSFLADIVDTEGYAIKDNSSTGSVREDIIAEANSATDIFERQSSTINQANLQQTNTSHHNEIVQQMRNAIDKNNQIQSQNATIIGHFGSQPAIETVTPLPNPTTTPIPVNPTPEPPVAPDFVEEVTEQQPTTNPQPIIQDLPQPELPPETTQGTTTEQDLPPELPLEPHNQDNTTIDQEFIDLANNSDYSIETISKEANRINDKQNDEVYISLH